MLYLTEDGLVEETWLDSFCKGEREIDVVVMWIVAMIFTIALLPHN